MRARIAGLLYLVSIASALLGEAFVRGKLLYAVSLVPILCFLAVTILLYTIFKSVNRTTALFGAVFQIVSLAFEAIEVHPLGINAGLVFHGLYCICIGYLGFRSGFVPRALGLLMMAGGLMWLTNAWPSLERGVSPYDTAAGFIGEGLFMLWLLVTGANVRRPVAARVGHR